VAGLLGGLCGYAVVSRPTDPLPFAAFSACFLAVSALLVIGLRALARVSALLRRVARHSGWVMLVSSIAFILLLGETGGGLSRGIEGAPPILVFAASALFLLSVIVGVLSFTTWIVVGLPMVLRARAEQPAQGAALVGELLGYVADRPHTEDSLAQTLGHDKNGRAT
jgi:hypothetical protein